MRSTVNTIVFVMCLLCSSHAAAVAYCALRDPVSAIQHFYPTYTTYKALDGRVDTSVRAVLDEQLPGVHFSEFGTHTLYVVFKDFEVIGYVHARTEKGDWGLDELVWALSPTLRVKDVRYQRSRSAGRALVESPEFVGWLGGRDLKQIVGLLNPEGTGLKERPEFISAEFESTAVTVVRSAVKTLVITDYVWPVAAE